MRALLIACTLLLFSAPALADDPAPAAKPAASAAQQPAYTFKWTPEKLSGKYGLSLAAVGISLVFVALLMISLFIAALPHILRPLEVWFPQPVKRAPPARTTTGAGEEAVRLAVAIAVANHARARGR